MNQAEVVSLMAGSRSEAEWNANVEKVKAACGGYPEFWYLAIVESGLAYWTSARFGARADIEIVPDPEKLRQRLP